YNKRDLPVTSPTTALEGDLNWRRVPYFLAVAVRGEGVLETFEEAVTRVATSVFERFGSRAQGVSSEQLRAAVHEKMAPMYSRQKKWAGLATSVKPQSSPAHLVVTRVPSPAAGASQPLDTQ